MTQSQVRTEVEATVSLEFESWGKLQLSLSSGSQEMNLLATTSVPPRPSLEAMKVDPR